MAEEWTYQKLRAAGAREFLTDGPNSGGVAGLLCHDGWVWWFVADWAPELGSHPMRYADFLAKGDGHTRGYREAAAFIRRELGLDPVV